jgi:hypothetical protein
MLLRVSVPRKSWLLALLFFAGAVKAQTQPARPYYVLFLDRFGGKIPYDSERLKLDTSSDAFTKTHIRVIPVQMTPRLEADTQSLLYQAVALTLTGHTATTPLTVFFLNSQAQITVGEMDLSEKDQMTIFRAFLQGIVMNYDPEAQPKLSRFSAHIENVRPFRTYVNQFFPESVAVTSRISAQFKKLMESVDSAISKFKSPDRARRNLDYIRISLQQIAILQHVGRQLESSRTTSKAAEAEVDQAIAVVFKRLFLTLQEADQIIINLTGIRNGGPITAGERDAFKSQIITETAKILLAGETPGDRDRLMRSVMRLLPDLNFSNPLRRLKYWFFPPNWIEAVLRVAFFNRVEKYRFDEMRIFGEELLKILNNDSEACDFRTRRNSL